jgi:sporulation protein YlmC with PRC-barrel domain
MTVSLPFINKVLYLRVKAVLWAINYGLVPSRLILGRYNDYVIPWSRIKRIGMDVILVEANEYAEPVK